MIRNDPLMLEIKGPNLRKFARSFTARQPGSNSPNYTMNANLEKRNESSKQRDDDNHASNQSTIILDEHKNLRSNLY